MMLILSSCVYYFPGWQHEVQTPLFVPLSNVMTGRTLCSGHHQTLVGSWQLEIRWSNVCRYSGTMTNYTRCKEDCCASWCWGIHFFDHLWDGEKLRTRPTNWGHLPCRLCILLICSSSGHEKLGHAICHWMLASFHKLHCRSVMDRFMRATRTCWVTGGGSMSRG